MGIEYCIECDNKDPPVLAQLMSSSPPTQESALWYRIRPTHSRKACMYSILDAGPSTFGRLYLAFLY